MRSINKVIIIGNLTRNATIKDTPSGVQYALFGVATNRNFSTKTGERKSTTEFHECCSFKKWIVGLAQSGALTKGKYVYVEGYLKTRSWDDPSGKKFFRTEIIGDDVLLLTKRNRDDEMLAPSEHPVADDVDPVFYDESVEEDRTKGNGEDDLF